MSTKHNMKDGVGEATVEERFKKNDAHTEVENGEMRRPITIDSKQARAKQ